MNLLPRASIAPTPRTGRVYAGYRSPMGVNHWLELGWALERATELATYDHQAREVVVLDGHAVTRLHHYPYHSPSGFEWGYGGSGPAELARCILLDHYRVTPRRRGALYPPAAGELPVSYQAFKFAVITRLPHDRAWSVTSSEIAAWAVGEEDPNPVDRRRRRRGGRAPPGWQTGSDGLASRNCAPPRRAGMTESTVDWPVAALPLTPLGGLPATPAG